MPRRRRQAKIPTPAWERPRGAIGSRVLGRGFQFYGAVAVGLLIVAALGIIGYGVVADELEKRARPGSTAIQVEDTRYRVDYFASRLKMYVDQNGGAGIVQPSVGLPAVSAVLIQEEIVRRFAGEFDVEATDEEITGEIATRLGITADDESFGVVFEQELARSEMSESDYRQMTEATVLSNELQEKFLAEVPELAESVHIRQILVSEQEKADELVSDLKGGEDFAALAAEDFNLDVQNKENGGDAGWVPRGVLDASTEELVFAVEVGEITTIPVPSGVLVLEMLKKDEERQVEEDLKGTLGNRAFLDWVQEKQQPLEDDGAIVNNMDVDDGDFDKIEWAIERAFQS